MRYNKNKLIEARNDSEKIIDLLNNKDLDLLSYVEEFRNKKINEYIKKNKHDIGIYTIGFSPYTTILSLSIVNPKDKVILIFTEESYQHKNVFIKFLELLGSKAEIILRKTSYDSDTAEVFNIISNEIKINLGKRIAIDITGGKKPTVAAAYLAASFYPSLDILYLNFHGYENDVAKYGTEYISVLLNPNNIFSTVERKALEEMYISKNFKGARRLSKDIERRLKKSKNLLIEYKTEEQIKEVETIYYFSKLYELRNDFNYQEININSNFLNRDEIEGIKCLSSFLWKINEIEKTRYKETKEIKIYQNFKECDEIIFMVLERYNGALMIKDIDLQSYIIRLLSAVELAGIILTKGKVKKVFNKIDCLQDRKLKVDLHDLRIFRNELSLNHGFNFISRPDGRYEKAVLKYIAITFNKSESESNNIILNKLRYRNYKEIFN